MLEHVLECVSHADTQPGRSTTPRPKHSDRGSYLQNQFSPAERRLLLLSAVHGVLAATPATAAAVRGRGGGERAGVVHDEPLCEVGAEAAADPFPSKEGVDHGQIAAEELSGLRVSGVDRLPDVDHVAHLGWLNGERASKQRDESRAVRGNGNTGKEG